ncbi:TcpQ domain-containing protein [Pseudomonas sp. Snoq117.2]|uniref:PFGI-1 class ICE element type IV pilus protein PilL2 n=1 Tax=Pseudomonas sp. Snoq117.2 TaxID=1500302 RepID=UPI0008C158F7|nr:TcpQ domain-containing protein [Pseudomonas sp. Snoq117.2]SEO97894.1 type IV pili sensor histidine kinase and response regulator [Pseudomonas sp. Snoq117.2]
MIWKLTTLSPLAFAVALAGCAQQEPAPSAPGPDSSRNPELLQPDLYPKGAASEPQVRYGRYTLVNTAPETEQRDLMAQIIDVNIPANMKPTVRDAMQYVVNRSGYSLCGPEQGHVNILFTRPLPAAQYKLGPMSLRNTLQVLAGPAWQVKVDEVVRSVCFVLRPGYQLPEGQRYGVAPAAPPTTAATKSVSTASNSVVTVATVPATKPLETHTEPAKPATNVTATPAVKPMPAGAALTSAPVKAPGESLHVGQSPNASLAKGTSAIPAAVAASVPAKTASSAAVTLAKPLPTVGATAAGAYTLPSVRLTEPVSAMTQTWDAPIGSTLRQSVEAWAKRAGWQVVWEPDDLDYPIEAALHFRGTFAEAVAQVFPLYDGARRSFIVDGNSSQRIVHVSERKKS